jgi:hypothetical protein
MILRFPEPAEAIHTFPVPELIRPKHRHPDRWRWLVLLAATAAFLYFVGRFHIPGKGFTALINFGDAYSARRLPEISATTTYIVPESTGYDAQWYAQLAVRPDLRSAEIATAVDNVPYRARRIFFPLVASLLGGGDPQRTLEVYALTNVVCWILLGAVLLHWLPPRCWGNVARWIAVMLSYGLSFSVRNALVDGPALLLIATGVLLHEKGRDLSAAAVLGLAGLGKETCILAGAALVHAPFRSLRDWARLALKASFVVLPLALWLFYLLTSFGFGSGEMGARNFAFPLVELWQKTVRCAAALGGFPRAFEYAIGDCLLLVSLVSQFLFFALRPRPMEAWWRIGAAFAALMAILGEAVWEGFPSAAGRVVLPMAFAFNILLPRGPRWWPLFILGNLSVFCSPTFIRLPLGIERPVVEMPAALDRADAAHLAVTVRYDGPWHLSEHSVTENWHWTGGPVSLEITNSLKDPLRATLRFGINSRDARHVTVSIDGRQNWSSRVDTSRRNIEIPLLIPAGSSHVEFGTDKPPYPPVEGRDSREVAFRIYDLQLRVEGLAPAP